MIEGFWELVTHCLLLEELDIEMDMDREPESFGSLPDASQPYAQLKRLEIRVNQEREIIPRPTYDERSYDDDDGDDDEDDDDDDDGGGELEFYDCKQLWLLEILCNALGRSVETLEHLKLVVRDDPRVVPKKSKQPLRCLNLKSLVVADPNARWFTDYFEIDKKKIKNLWMKPVTSNDKVYIPDQVDGLSADLA
ncbi:hypothetical protein ABW20_dc0102772 [Dactylellina cionopaga]|nr:hypothetical protein ABW20_dc0102772 [Dactylellina cionopaga]